MHTPFLQEARPAPGRLGASHAEHCLMMQQLLTVLRTYCSPQSRAARFPSGRALRELRVWPRRCKASVQKLHLYGAAVGKMKQYRMDLKEQGSRWAGRDEVESEKTLRQEARGFPYRLLQQNQQLHTYMSKSRMGVSQRMKFFRSAMYQATIANESSHRLNDQANINE